jgi:CheY-like chemotaxis protein
MARIVIVEDEAIIAMENKTGLKNAGHEIVAVVSAAPEAIKAFEEKKPDLILMDIIIKGAMDGIEVMIEIRKQSTIPVLFLTGNADAKTKQRLSTISNSSHLSKPFLAKEMIEKVNALLTQNRLV